MKSKVRFHVIMVETDAKPFSDGAKLDEGFELDNPHGHDLLSLMAGMKASASAMMEVK